MRIGTAAVAILLVVLFACDDKGFKPAEPVDYPVYFWNTVGSQNLYTYHPLYHYWDDEMYS